MKEKTPFNRFSNTNENDYAYLDVDGVSYRLSIISISTGIGVISGEIICRDIKLQSTHEELIHCDEFPVYFDPEINVNLFAQILAKRGYYNLTEKI